MQDILPKLRKFVKINKADILLLIAVILACMFSFSLGYITAKMEEKESLQYEIPKYEESSLEENIFVRQLI